MTREKNIRQEGLERNLQGLSGGHEEKNAIKSLVVTVEGVESTRHQEGGLEAMPEYLTLTPLHLGQEAGRTFRKDSGVEWEGPLGK